MVTDNIDVPTLLHHTEQAFVQEVESLRATRSNVQSPSGSSSGGEHPAVHQILQDVLELDMLSQSEVAEQKLAHQVRTNNVRQQAQEMLEKFKASRDTANGSSSPAAGVNPFTASGDSHPAANLPHSAASATIQEPSQFLNKRLHQKTTAPHHGMQFAPTPSATSQAAKPSNKGIKRKIDDPDRQAHKAP